MNYLSPMARPTPFDLVFASLAEERFPGIRDALAASGREATDRDAFLLEREAVLLLRDLRPDNGVGEGIDQLSALVHHAYVLWDRGGVTLGISLEQLPELLGADPGLPEPGEIRPAYYAQFPERRIWAEVLAGAPPEPLDGCFVHTTGNGKLRVLGIFGLHPDRMGFSVAEAEGARPASLARPDGTALFSPTLPGGTAARLHSVSGGEELLELGWRTTAGAVQWTR